jgi:hypothetical protein
MRYRVIKTDYTTLPWSIVDETDKFICRRPTKRLASLLCELLNGNLTNVQTWYLETYQRWYKVCVKNRYQGASATAGMYAAQEAREFYMTPVQVDANPQTGIPNKLLVTEIRQIDETSHYRGY